VARVNLDVLRQRIATLQARMTAVAEREADAASRARYEAMTLPELEVAYRELVEEPISREPDSPKWANMTPSQLFAFYKQKSEDM
jgi:hypothetical protein